MTGIDRDILLTRVLDGEATPEDWAAFRAMAACDPRVWTDLADTQQDRAELALAMAEVVQIADHVDAPIETLTGENLTRRLNQAVAWVGWAAAAMLAIGAIASRNIGPAQTNQPDATKQTTQQAGLFSVTSPEDALKLYFDKGQKTGSVLGEIPDRVLLQTTPSADGAGYDIVYIRQLVERTHVNELYQLAKDEAGRSVPVEYSPPKRNVHIVY